MTVMLPADQSQLGDLARRLREDSSGTLRTEYDQFFLDCRAAAERHTHEPLAPDDFAAHSIVVEAATVSSEVIRMIWDAMHSPRSG